MLIKTIFSIIGVIFYFPIWNIYSFIHYFKNKKEKDIKCVEVTGIIISSAIMCILF